MKVPLPLGQCDVLGRNQESLQVCPASANGYGMVLVLDADTPSYAPRVLPSI